MNFDLARADALPSGLREAYLDSLPEPQLHYMERLVSRAEYAVILGQAEPVGYIAARSKQVVEFYLTPAALPMRSELFYSAAKHLGAKSALVKSFDALALSAIAEQNVSAQVVGINFLAFEDDNRIGLELALKDAHPADINFIRGVAAGLYEDPVEIAHNIAKGELFLFGLDEAVVGCGFLTRIRPNRNAFDLGMAVAPAFRRRGIGQAIVRSLRRHCVNTLQGRPVAGCAIENIASRRTLERAGFISRHSVIEFTW